MNSEINYDKTIEVSELQSYLIDGYLKGISAGANLRINRVENNKEIFHNFEDGGVIRIRRDDKCDISLKNIDTKIIKRLEEMTTE